MHRTTRKHDFSILPFFSYRDQCCCWLQQAKALIRFITLSSTEIKQWSAVSQSFIITSSHFVFNQHVSVYVFSREGIFLSVFCGEFHGWCGHDEAHFVQFSSLVIPCNPWNTFIYSINNLTRRNQLFRYYPWLSKHAPIFKCFWCLDKITFWCLLRIK